MWGGEARWRDCERHRLAAARGVDQDSAEPVGLPSGSPWSSRYVIAGRHLQRSRKAECRAALRTQLLLSVPVWTPPVSRSVQSSALRSTG
eukprot:15458722-Alexandrium_andersonii.AAC.1